MKEAQRLLATLKNQLKRLEKESLTFVAGENTKEFAEKVTKTTTNIQTYKQQIDQLEILITEETQKRLKLLMETKDNKTIPAKKINQSIEVRAENEFKTIHHYFKHALTTTKTMRQIDKLGSISMYADSCLLDLFGTTEESELDKTQTISEEETNIQREFYLDWINKIKLDHGIA